MHSLRNRLLVACCVAALAAFPARAQYYYPPGYGGWGGWGGASTPVGSAAMGMGAFAAGAGTYNVDTAQARAVNANTAMQVNQYMYEVNLNNAKSYYARVKAQQKEASSTGEEIYKRLRTNPDEHDIHSGDALNVVLDDLLNPTIFPKVIEAASQPIQSQLVKNVVFRYAPNMIAISLEDLSGSGVPDVLMGDSFRPDREKLRPLVQKARQEVSSQGRVDPETLASIRSVIKGVQQKVASSIPQGSNDRREADNFLKALFGLTKMLQTPDVAQYLRELNTVSTTTLGHLIGFMHSFNLKFGAAQSPVQENAYDQLYPMLLALREQVQAPPANPYQRPGSKPDPKKLNEFFADMDYAHVAPPSPGQEQPVPAPPNPQP